MRLVTTFLLLVGLTLGPLVPAHSYTLQLNNTATVQFRWPTTTITVALSDSLNNPPANIKPGSDVVGAARRALRHWAEAGNIKFIITTSPNEQMADDDVNLITVSANPGVTFNRSQTGRARVFSDPATGAITEADVAINPTLPFSTDGSFDVSDGNPAGQLDTYDLETTFTHEIGHMLGLEHSGIVGAIMQPRQARNGTFNLPAIRRPTLADDDRAGLRAVYGPLAGSGSIAGRVSVGTEAGPAVFGAHVWAEEVSTGRAYAGNVTLPNGNYRIDALPPGQYRIIAEPLNEPVAASEIASRAGAYQGLQSAQPTFPTVEVAGVAVGENAITPLNIPVSNVQPFLNPRFIGVGDQLSTVSGPVVPGSTTTVLVGGFENEGTNLQTISPADISITSGYFTVDPASVQALTFMMFDLAGQQRQVQVLSFNVSVSILAAPGDYSVRLARRNSGTGLVDEVAYVSGGLTIALPNGVSANGANLIDDPQFFVAQHYRDFLNREPDPSGLAFWTNQITSCGANAGCREVRRINVSAAFFLSTEFQQTGFLVHRAYHAAFGNRVAGVVPVTLQEFLPDTQRLQRGVIVGQGNWEQQLEANKQSYFSEFVARPDFVAAYPANLSPEEYVDRLNANTGGALSQAERDALVAGLSQGAETRASVLRKVAEDPEEGAREVNRAFVLIEYFGYLRRNPNDAPEPGLDFAGYNFWLRKLNQFGGNYIAAEMVKAFITSEEYRRRFGPA